VCRVGKFCELEVPDQSVFKLNLSRRMQSGVFGTGLLHKPTFVPSAKRSTYALRAAPRAEPIRLTTEGFVAGPNDSAPTYDEIDSQVLNSAIMALFRSKMVDAIGEDSHKEG
jgi:hypothetical protein